MMFDVENHIADAVNEEFKRGGRNASIGSYFAAGEAVLTERERQRIVEWYVRRVTDGVLRQRMGL